MQRLVEAIDKAAKSGVYSLEETAGILKAIEQVGAVVQEHNKRAKAMQEAVAEAQAEVPAEKPAPKKAPKKALAKA